AVSHSRHHRDFRAAGAVAARRHLRHHQKVVARPMSTIELRKVTKRFGSFTAVSDVDLSVAAGEVVCLLGPSGCGKTTTLRIIAGLERASGGDVMIGGKRMNDLRPDQRDIAMVFQFYALYPALTVRQNIMFPLHCEKLDEA